MKLSEGLEWGLHCATVLALAPPGAALPTGRLAEFHGVPGAYLAKHLQAMSRAGILESVQGPGGGYRLARPPAEISVLDVVEAIDGRASAFRCTEIRRRGPARLPDSDPVYRVPCSIHAVMNRADDAWRAELRDTSIADITRMLVEKLHPKAAEKGAAWFREVLS